MRLRSQLDSENRYKACSKPARHAPDCGSLACHSKQGESRQVGSRSALPGNHRPAPDYRAEHRRQMGIGRNQPHRANFQERGGIFTAGGYANVHFDAPACAQNRDGSRDIRRDTQAEGGVVLRADGDDPQGGTCAGQHSGNGRNGAVTAAYHEHANSVMKRILDCPCQIAARLYQVYLWRNLPGLHLVDHIHDFDRELI